MQLASTLFAICVLEIKPQAEKLLKLPSDSLIKEIELTQDLLELFMKYQIPSDMLTWVAPISPFAFFLRPAPPLPPSLLQNQLFSSFIHFFLTLSDFYQVRR